MHNNSTISENNSIVGDESGDLEGIDLLTYSIIVYLFLCFSIGFPLNINTFLSLRRKMISGTNRTTLLKIHLNISDLLVLKFLALWRAVYEAAQFWHGGAFLCKFYKFGHALGLELSSAIIVCIAFDRLLYLIRPFTPYTKALRRTKTMIWVAWLYAIVFSVPQLFAFQLFDVAGHERSPQCAFWYFSKVKAGRRPTDLDDILFVLHNYSHITTTFWLPIVAMIVFYSGIIWHIWRRYRFPKDDTTSPLNSTQYTELGGSGSCAQNSVHLRSVDKRSPTEDQTTGCPELVPSIAQPSLPTDYDSMPELVESSVQKTNNNDVIQLLPCLVDFREPSTGNNFQVQADEDAPAGPSRTVSRDLPSSHQSTYRKEQLTRLPARTTKTTIILINAYLFCWLPININLAWGYIDNTSWLSSGDVLRFVQLLIVLNSVINPLIYGVPLKEILNLIVFRKLLLMWNRIKQLAKSLPCCNGKTEQATEVDNQETPTSKQTPTRPSS